MSALNPIYVLLAVFGFLVLYFIYIFNDLVKKRERVKEASSSIEVMLKMRADLVPNLVEVVKVMQVTKKKF
jgi:LemA protein